ncbi:SpoIIE family protein phosphatase [Actinomadura graeca]|uniref:SpoIIE family protein phosphatase n=1 Tax=Actinomadura graeca TaxID=2750812 RepID=A0ABX8QP22_9ACTN|nr:SpoIIE family protein phosphatase [Actinomadura graeca]QXJ19864.1 SpoIIE family protein phosphatase [Actinomadura graeca]
MDSDASAALATTVERLRRELEAERRGRRARTAVEQAKGLLAERLGCGPDTAYDHLLELAADTGVEPATAAALLLGTDPAAAAAPAVPAPRAAEHGTDPGPPRRPRLARSTDAPYRGHEVPGWDASPPDADAAGRDAGGGVGAVMDGAVMDGAAGEGAGPWPQAVLDVMQGPGAFMTPVRDASGRVVEFRVEAVNADATALPGLFEEYARVLETGVPLRRGHGEGGPSVRACRVGGGVLVGWCFHDDDADLAAQLAQAQRLGGIGWGRFDLATGDARWSEQVYEIFGRDRAAGPLPLDRLADHVVPADLPRAEHLLRTLLVRREPAGAELRLRAGAEVRHVRVTAEPALDPLGEPAALHVVFQDVSQRRRCDETLAATRRQLMRQRRRIAEERHIAVELQRAILPLPRGPRALPGLRAAVRYLPARSESRVGGDWYEAAALPGGEVFLAIGDVSGHGLPAAAQMARLRNALSGLTCTGAAPDRLLGWLNRLLLERPSPDRRSAPTASVIAARYEPGPRVLTWAQAGHPPPLLMRGGRAELLEPPEGVLLGALEKPCLDLAITRLEHGDLLVFYTDGLIERRDRDLAEGFGLLRAAVEERAAAPPDAVIDHVLRSLGAANPDDDTCVLAVQVA